MKTYLLPIRTMSPLNVRQHWAIKARRNKQERAYAAHALNLDRPPRLPAVITMTRIAPRHFDTDNLAASFKALRDGIADAYGVKDNTPQIEWRYAQRRGEPKQYAAEIVIEHQEPMKKQKLTILERAFAAEVSAAITKGIHLLQTRSKLADELVSDGLLRKVTLKALGVIGTFSVTGYELTELGRLTYCMSAE